MTTGPGTTAVAAGTELLERALAYTRGALALVRAPDLGLPTPCSAWRLGDLLLHMDDSLQALHEAAALGRVPLVGVPDGATAGDPPVLASLRQRGCTMLGAWSGLATDEPVTLGSRTLPASVVAVAGAFEVAVHGWDVARACGDPRPLPDDLAAALLRHAPTLIGAEDRGRRFHEPVGVPARCPPSDRLLAFTGRSPDWDL